MTSTDLAIGAPARVQVHRWTRAEITPHTEQPRGSAKPFSSQGRCRTRRSRRIRAGCQALDHDTVTARHPSRVFGPPLASIAYTHTVCAPAVAGTRTSYPWSGPRAKAASTSGRGLAADTATPVSYTHLRA